MLRSTKELIGYKLAAEDGEFGRVKDFLFDQRHWTVRWMVADTGDWLPKRKVLISPVSLGEPDWNSALFSIRMTKSDIESAPGLNADEPVSREYETKWYDRYQYAYYWSGIGEWGGVTYPGDLVTRREKAELLEESPEEGADILRSMKEVAGYHIHAIDGEVGHVEEFILDDEFWTLRYLVVDTRNWLPGRKVLISPTWVSAIDWAERSVSVDLVRDVVKDSPKYDPSAPVNREYEARLYDFYGRPIYWT